MVELGVRRFEGGLNVGQHLFGLCRYISSSNNVTCAIDSVLSADIDCPGGAANNNDVAESGDSYSRYQD